MLAAAALLAPRAAECSPVDLAALLLALQARAALAPSAENLSVQSVRRYVSESNDI